MLENELQRVINPEKISEKDQNGRTCRVCLFGAISLASDAGVITEEEERFAYQQIRKTMEKRGDSVNKLITVPDRETMFQVYDETSQSQESNQP